MSTVAISKNEQNTISSGRFTITRRTSSKSLKIHDNVKKTHKQNQLANSNNKLIDDIKETKEMDEIKTLKQENTTLQNKINNAKLILIDEKTSDSSQVSLQNLLQKHKQKMQQLATENEQLKTELCKHQNEHSETLLHLTQKNEHTIKSYDQKLKQLISKKDKITAELNESNAFKLLLRQEHQSELQQLQQKLHTTESSCKEQIEKMQQEMQQLSRTSMSALLADKDIYGDNEHLSFKERSFEDLKLRISYSDLYISNKRRKSAILNGYSNMKYILRQYYMTRIIVFGIGMFILPTQMIASVSLGTANGFNWIYSYKYGTKQDLMKQSVLFSIELLSAKYLNDVKHIGCAVAMHGLFDLFNVYQLYKHQTCNNKSVIKEVGISAMSNVVIGIGTMLLSPKQNQSK